MEAAETIEFIPKNKMAIIPKRHSDGAAGYDLFSISSDKIEPNTTKAIKLGFALKFPDNLLGYVCGRSGLSLKNGINVRSSYAFNEQDIEIYLHNNSSETFYFEQGSRIAQLVFLKLLEPKFNE